MLGKLEILNIYSSLYEVEFFINHTHEDKISVHPPKQARTKTSKAYIYLKGNLIFFVFFFLFCFLSVPLLKNVSHTWSPTCGIMYFLIRVQTRREHFKFNWNDAFIWKSWNWKLLTLSYILLLNRYNFMCTKLFFRKFVISDKTSSFKNWVFIHSFHVISAKAIHSSINKIYDILTCSRRIFFQGLRLTEVDSLSVPSLRQNKTVIDRGRIFKKCTFLTFDKNFIIDYFFFFLLNFLIRI